MNWEVHKSKLPWSGKNCTTEKKELHSEGGKNNMEFLKPLILISMEHFLSGTEASSGCRGFLAILHIFVTAFLASVILVVLCLIHVNPKRVLTGYGHRHKDKERDRCWIYRIQSRV